MENVTKGIPGKVHYSTKPGHIKYLKTYSLDEIFNYINLNPYSDYYIDKQGYSCKLRRPKIYNVIGCTCKECGLQASFFVLEDWVNGGFHFNLYGYNEKGEMVMMTIDHILAKSKGGKNHISNYQPLCKVCNENKADS